MVQNKYAKAVWEEENIEAQIFSLLQEIVKLDAEQSTCRKEIETLLGKMSDVQDEWYEVYKRGDIEQDKTCPICGQAMPLVKLETACINFNHQKAKRLEEIAAERKRLKQLEIDLNTKIAALEKEINNKLAILQEQKAAAKRCKQRVEALRKEQDNIKNKKEEYDGD